MANRIRDLRCEKKISQVQLSILLGVTQETISAYEVGKHLPSLSALMRLRKILNASMDYIMGKSNIRFPENESTLKNDEIELLSYYRELKPLQREKVFAYLQGISSYAPPGMLRETS